MASQLARSVRNLALNSANGGKIISRNLSNKSDEVNLTFETLKVTEPHKNVFSC